MSWKEGNLETNPEVHIWDIIPEDPTAFKVAHDKIVDEFKSEFKDRVVGYGTYDIGMPNGATHWDGYDFAARGPVHPKGKVQGYVIPNQQFIDNLKLFWTDEMLEKAALHYEEAVDNAVDNLTSLLEPLTMAVLGVLVGGLLIAMYLPIFQLGNVV